MNTRVLRSAAVLALAVVGAGVQAQSFTPGYVVVDGDTLRGEVAIGTEPEAARGVAFRPSPEAPAAQYDTGRASAFGADGGRRYRRGQFPTDAVRVGPEDPVVFARVVRDGALGLVAYEAVDGRPAFALDRGGEWVGLPYVRARREGLRERRPYRQVLAGVLTDACGPPDVDRLAYDERALVRVVDAHNACLDPGYAPPARARGVRRRLAVAGEVSVGAVTGRFRRASRPAFETEDPALSSLRAGALAEFRTPLLRDVVRPVLGVEYSHHVVRLAAGTASSGLADISTVHVRLGLRLVPRVRAARVRIGVGLLAGPSVRRDGTSEVPVEERDDTVRFTNAREFESSTGQYVELGVGPRSLPVELVLRGQTAVFTSGNAFLPISLGNRYGAQTLSLGVAARF